VSSVNHATFEEASAWVQRHHGAPVNMLRRLYEQVQPKAAKTG
jgi:hypothetical protein